MNELHAAGSARGSDGNSPSALLSVLRGRIQWVALLSVLFAGPIGFLGYKSADPMYEASGELMISRRDVIYSTALDQPTGYLKDYIESEARRIKSRAVFQRALQLPELAETGFPMDEAGRLKLKKLIKVKPPVSGQLITISAEDPNRFFVTNAVNAVLKGYILQNEEEQRARREGGIEQTVRREKAVQARLDSLLLEGQPLFEQFGSAEALERQLGSLDDLKLEIGSERREVSSLIESLLAEIDSKTRQLTLHEAGKEVVGPPMVELKLDDERMTELDERRHLTATSIQQSLKAGLLPTHRTIIMWERDLAEIESLITDRAKSLERRWWSRLGVQVDDMRSQIVIERRRLDDLTKRQAEIDAQRLGVTAQIHQVREISKNIDAVRAELTEIARVRGDIEEQLAEEFLGQARIHELAEEPEEDAISSDPRTIRAAAGVVLGVMISIGGVILTSGLKHRLRYIDEFTPERLGASCLGAVPDIKQLTAGNFSEIERYMEPMRARIEVYATRPGNRGSQVLAVTSPGPSDGKSTVARALAASFAMAGHRTVLIDADPDGRATTAAFAMSGEPGFVDYLIKPDLTMIQASGKSGLWILPAGRVDERTVSSSYGAVSQMIDDLREHFEQIVIDTGGILGSTESSLIGRAADGMVLVISRGKTLDMADRAIKRINEIGGSCIGIIFNRAEPGDFMRAMIAVSSVRRNVGDPGVVPVEIKHEDGEGDQTRSSARA